MRVNTYIFLFIILFIASFFNNALAKERKVNVSIQINGEPLNYFMYPYAEADGKPLNEDLYGFNLGYKITFREL